MSMNSVPGRSIAGARLLALFGVLLAPLGAPAAPRQFVVVNISHTAPATVFEEVAKEFKAVPAGDRAIGIAGIFSYLQRDPAKVKADLEGFLRLSERSGIPVVVQLDGENWWGGRPDLWNWWNPAQPGFSPSNRFNVEWTSWSPEDAVKIAWRNWGRQIRVLPPPNLMSPRYRVACHEGMRALVPVVRDWWQGLPAEKRHLLIGIKLGWESSIGVNAWHYPGGNALLERPATEDPQTGLKTDELPGRGVATLGYAAVKTAGIRTEGQITEADQAEVVRRHLEDLCRLAGELRMPRDLVFTHVAGWKENELLYQSAVNDFSCPGWSFYQHAADPGRDTGVQTALNRSSAPHWAAVEWLFQGPRQTSPWRLALEKTLGQPGCRYLCIYNWEGVRGSKEILDAMRQSLEGSPARPAKPARAP